jgi:two-component system, OmpR family, KDP operon response regulator KdpE
MPGQLILIAEDHAAIRETLSEELGAAGYRTIEASDGREAIERFEESVPDLVLTDIAMPDRDGFRVVAAVRKHGATPIIVLSVLGGESDKVRALDLGADDYVTKPFSVPELLARIRTQLRRTAPQLTRLEFEGLSIDVPRREVRQGDREIRLTPTEFAILEILARSAGKPVSSREIARRAWATGDATPDTVRVHVGSLRRKLEPDPSVPRFIVTEPWVGYRFIGEPK